MIRPPAVAPPALLQTNEGLGQKTAHQRWFLMGATGHKEASECPPFRRFAKVP